jgi:hypothetical protein
MHSDLQAKTGQYSEKAAVVGLAAGLLVLGLWATGILKGKDSSLMCGCIKHTTPVVGAANAIDMKAFCHCIRRLW